jgi:enamine deaminase RidA (YjgF/YER057c/UK114 family)
MVWRILGTILALTLMVGSAGAQRKKKNKKDEEPMTQTLEVLADPPAATKGDSSHMVFFVSPLSTKGLLSQQAKDALSVLRKQARGGVFLKLRAFVAGRGDARRVTAIVSEQFTEWKLALPAVAVIQVGAFALEGAQVQIEATVEDRKTVNPNGIEFVSGKPVMKPLGEGGDVNAVRPLLDEALSALPADMLSVTCLVSSIEGGAALEQAMAAKFPGAARTLVQAQRATGSGLAHCDGVQKKPTGNPERLVLTGTVIGFGGEEKDVKLAESRLEKLLEGQGSKVLVKKVYAVSRSLEKYLGTIRLVEGVGSNEAAFAIEAVGILP